MRHLIYQSIFAFVLAMVLFGILVLVTNATFTS